MLSISVREQQKPTFLLENRSEPLSFMRQNDTLELNLLTGPIQRRSPAVAVSTPARVYPVIIHPLD